MFEASGYRHKDDEKENIWGFLNGREC